VHCDKLTRTLQTTSSKHLQDASRVAALKRPSRKRRPTEKQRDIDNDHNDNKSSQGGSQKKQKKARKEQEIKVAKDAEGATKTYDENEVKLAKVILNGKRIAASWPSRQDQADGIRKLRKRLDADAQRFDNSAFDILGDAAMKRLAPILIKLSGKKKSATNRMSVLHVTNKKYKKQLKADPT
jgi:hypothetical protein